MSETGMDEAGHTAPMTPPGAGATLRAAREEQGLSLTDVAARTRIPLRHLEAIESGNLRALPSATYAVGFARAFARAVGADEVAVAAAVRDEVDRVGRRAPEYVPYETADPARVPSRGLTVVALGVALAIVVLAGLWFATDLFQRPDDGASVPAVTAAAAPSAAAPRPVPTPARPAQVTLIADDEVWLRVYDAADATLFQGTMKQGDRYDVPAGADDPKINVGRPDKLQVTLNGSAMPPLGDGSRPVKGVPVGAAAVAARMSAGGIPANTGTAAPPPAAAGDQ